MLTLRTLGSLDLRDSEGKVTTTILSQPKRFALLVYLASARPQGFHRRDTLLTLFWPERDDIHARNALSQSLSFLRQNLSEDVIMGRGADEVGLDVRSIRSDVEDFERAVTEGQWAEALDIYGGDFLRGFHVVEAWGFEDWMEGERLRLREAAADAAWSLAKEQIDRGSLVEAERTAQRALGLVWTDETPVRGFIEALGRAGDRAAALNFYEQFCERLQKELELEPSPETVEVARSLRSGKPIRPPESASDEAFSGPDRAPVGLRDAVGEGETGPHDRTKPGPDQKEPKLGPGVDSRSELRRRGPWWFSGMGLIGIVGYFGFFGTPNGPNSSEGAVVNSSHPTDARALIAVLPFEDLSLDPAHDYFSPGVREDLIEKLQGISTIAVMSGTATGRFGNGPDQATNGEIAAKLGADYLLGGSARLNGDSVWVTVRLTEGLSGVLLWSETYGEPFSPGDYTRLQSEIAHQIAFELRAPISPEEDAWLLAVPTRSQAAHQAYMEGLEAFRRERRNNVLNYDLPSERLLRQAIRLDPDFGLAHAHLAFALTYSQRTEDKGVRARQAAERALVLVPESPVARLAYSRSLYFLGDREEAARQLEEALKLAPDNTLLLRQHAWRQANSGDREAAIQTFRRAQRFDPHDPKLFQELGEVLIPLHRWDDALDAFAREMALSEAQASRSLMVQSYIHLARGNRDRAREMLSEMLKRHPNGPYGWVPFSLYTAVKSLMTPEERENALNAWLLESHRPWEEQLFRAVHEQDFGSVEKAKILWDSLHVARSSIPTSQPSRDALILMGVGKKDAALALARASVGDRPDRCGYSRGAQDVCRTLARILAHFGEFDEALDLIEEMLPAPSYFTVHILEADTIWAPLRGHPRFQALLEKYRDDVEH